MFLRARWHLKQAPSNANWDNTDANQREKRKHDLFSCSLPALWTSASASGEKNTLLTTLEQEISSCQSSLSIYFKFLHEISAELETDLRNVKTRMSYRPRGAVRLRLSFTCTVCAMLLFLAWFDHWTLWYSPDALRKALTKPLMICYGLEMDRDSSRLVSSALTHENPWKSFCTCHNFNSEPKVHSEFKFLSVCQWAELNQIILIFCSSQRWNCHIKWHYLLGIGRWCTTLWSLGRGTQL